MNLLKKIKQGFKIFLDGKAILDFEENDLIIFKVQGSKEYSVSFLDGVIRCNCEDYIYRWEKDYGSYICKHIWASIFQIIKIKFKKTIFLN
ncbi:MAG: SWIM zinc finger family protein [Methanobacteriaceae archaeon]|nr:SWIM zinc finger family protein [Methanobacteriaceae archaeon]MDZ4170921.1 SWIM zinc finger family protein [Methanobacteriaceae archaeon]